MNDSHKKTIDKRKLTKVRGYPGIFKIWIWSGENRRYMDVRSVSGCRAKGYRAVRRIRVLGKMFQQARNFYAIDQARAWRVEADPKAPVVKSSPYSLRELISDWRQWSKPPRFAQSTWEIYGKDLVHYEILLDVPVDELCSEDIDVWIRYCLDPSYPKKASRVSFLRELKTLSTILNWYREYKNSKFQSPMLNRHRRDCFFKRKKAKPDLSLSVADLERFLHRLKTHHRPVYYYLASFQALSGARIGETCGLTWDCVDLQNSIVEIKQVCVWQYRTKNPSLREGTKTGEIRKVVIPPRLVAILREWKDVGAHGSIVFHKDGNLLRYPAVQNAFKKAYRALGLPVRSTHVLRHSFASIFADQTNDIRGTQAALGHRDLRITQHYAKVAERTQRKAVAKFELGQVIPADEPPPPEGTKVISLVQRRK